MAQALSHSMTPLHEIISEDVARLELESYGIDPSVPLHSVLPLIGIDDPALFDASLPRPAGVLPSWPVGEVVRITRRSVYSGVSVAYRCVVGTAFYGSRRPLANLDLPDELIEEVFEEEQFAEPVGEGLSQLVEQEQERRLVPIDTEVLEREAEIATEEDEEEFE